MSTSNYTFERQRPPTSNRKRSNYRRRSSSGSVLGAQPRVRTSENNFQNVTAKTYSEPVEGFNLPKTKSRPGSKTSVKEKGVPRAARGSHEEQNMTEPKQPVERFSLSNTTTRRGSNTPVKEKAVVSRAARGSREEEKMADPERVESMDCNRLALAIGQGLGEDYVWHWFNEKWSIQFRVCEGSHNSLVMNLQSQEFSFVRNKRLRHIKSPPSMAAENMMNIVTRLSSRCATIITSSHVEADVGTLNWSLSHFGRRHSQDWRVPSQWRLLAGGWLDVGTATTIGLDKVRLNIGVDPSGLQREVDRLQDELSAAYVEVRKATEDLERAKRTQRTLEAEKRTTFGLVEKLKTEVATANRSKERLEKTNAFVESEKQSLTAKVQELETTVNRKTLKINSVTRKCQQVSDEHGVMERELRQVRGENERYQDVQYDYESKMDQFQTQKQEIDKLRLENDKLRAELTLYTGDGKTRPLGSKFWTVKDLASGLGELQDEQHMQASRTLEEDMGMTVHDINALLWRILFSVYEFVMEKFDTTSTVLRLDKRVLRNVFLSKIQEHFDELLDEAGVLANFERLFGDELSHFVSNRSVVDYVNYCAKVSWVLVLNHDPRMELYPIDNEVGQVGVLDNASFRSRFAPHASCRVKRVDRIRVVQYVLPGLRRLDGRTVVLPCVMAEKVESRNFGNHGRRTVASSNERSVRVAQNTGRTGRPGESIMKTGRGDSVGWKTQQISGSSPAQRGGRVKTGTGSRSNWRQSGSPANGMQTRPDGVMDPLECSIRVAQHRKPGTVVSFPSAPSEDETKTGRNNTVGKRKKQSVSGASLAQRSGRGKTAAGISRTTGRQQSGLRGNGVRSRPGSDPLVALEATGRKAELDDLLGEGEVDTAWDLLIECGVDLERGFAVFLKCAECDFSLGRLTRDGDFLCETSRHWHVTIERIVNIQGNQ